MSFLVEVPAKRAKVCERSEKHGESKDKVDKDNLKLKFALDAIEAEDPFQIAVREQQSSKLLCA